MQRLSAVFQYEINMRESDPDRYRSLELQKLHSLIEFAKQNHLITKERTEHKNYLKSDGIEETIISVNVMSHDDLIEVQQLLTALSIAIPDNSLANKYYSRVCQLMGMQGPEIELL